MNNRHRMDDLLSRHRLGELPSRFEKEVADFLSTPEGRRRLEQLEAEDERILLENPPRRVAEEIRRRVDSLERTAAASRNRTAVGWLAGSGLALALGGLAVVVSLRIPGQAPVGETARVAPVRVAPPPDAESVLPKTSAPEPEPPAMATRPVPSEARIAEAPAAPELPGDDGLRTKGEVRRLRVHRVLVPSGIAVSLVDGDTACAGNILQIGLLPGPAAFAAVLSLDAKGRVTRHIPEFGDSSIAIRDQLAAPHSFQLDDTPGFERFVLVQSDHPFPLAEAESRLRRAGSSTATHLPRGWSLQSILLVKSETCP